MQRVKTWACWVFGAVLGIAVAVVVLVTAVHSRGDSGPRPPQLLSESEGAITDVLLHYVPRLAGVVQETYADFLGAIEPDVQVAFVIPDDTTESERQQLLDWLSHVDPSLPGRTRLVASPAPITTWSKDRALVTGPDATGTAWLFSTAEPGRQWKERYGDWLTVASFAQASQSRYQRRVAPFDFDAGDFAIAQGIVIVDANLIEKNRHRDITDAATLKRRLEAWFEAPVTVLGAQPGDTPRHHLSMYMTPLHERVMLVGDPRQARDLVGAEFRPGPRSAESREPLVADFSEATQQRFDRAAAELEDRGWQVVRLPNVPLEDKTYITYTNGVYETRDGRRVAYLPAYGIDALDRAAREAYQRLGWEVRPIRVRHTYPFHGTVGCLVNVLGRR